MFITQVSQLNLAKLIYSIIWNSSPDPVLQVRKLNLNGRFPEFVRLGDELIPRARDAQVSWAQGCAITTEVQERTSVVGTRMCDNDRSAGTHKCRGHKDVQERPTPILATATVLI